MISELPAGPSQIAGRGDRHPFRLIGPEYVACCPRQVKRLAERSTAYFPCSRCNSPLVRLTTLIIYHFWDNHICVVMLQASVSESDSSEGVDPYELSSSGRSGDTADTLAEIAHQGWRELAWRLCEFEVKDQIRILIIEVGKLLS